MVYTLQERIIDLAKRSNNEKDFTQHLRAIMLELDVETEALSHSHSLLNSYTSNVDDLKSAQANNLLKTGYENIDEWASFYFSELVVIGARPAMGKTQLLINLALNFAANHKVLYFNLESSANNLTNRFSSVINNIPLSRLLKRVFTDVDLNNIEVNKSNDLLNNIFINDALQSKIGPLVLEAERMITEQGVKVIIVDYLQLLQATRYNRNREMEIAYVTMCLKELALKYNVCVILSSQLSRAVETRGSNKTPMLSDLRESGAIEQDADKVLFLYRPEYYGFEIDEMGEATRGLMKVIVAKNRSGAAMSLSLNVDDDFIKISAVDDLYKRVYIKINQSRLNEL